MGDWERYFAFGSWPRGAVGVVVEISGLIIAGSGLGVSHNVVGNRIVIVWRT